MSANTCNTYEAGCHAAFKQLVNLRQSHQSPSAIVHQSVPIGWPSGQLFGLEARGFESIYSAD